MNTCGNCGNAKPNSRDGTYCLLFGIMIYQGHEGCRYHKGKDDVGNGKRRDRLDAAAAEAE